MTSAPKNNFYSRWAVTYIAAVISINLAFSYVPQIELYNGTIWSVGSLLAGFVFLARDYAQRELGHEKVLVLMLTAGALSYIMADPFVAIASLVAFFISELVDYMVFTMYKSSFRRKVLLSSLISVPVDTAVFLFVIDGLTVFSFIVMTFSKMLALIYIGREK